MNPLTHRSPDILEAAAMGATALFAGAATLCCSVAMLALIASAVFGVGEFLISSQYGEDAGWLALSACASLAVFDALRSKRLLARVEFSMSRPMRSLFQLASAPLLLAIDRFSILLDKRSLFGYANPPVEDQWIFLPAPRDGASALSRMLLLARSVGLRIPVWSLMIVLAMISASVSLALAGPVLLELMLERLAANVRKWRSP